LVKDAVILSRELDSINENISYQRSHVFIASSGYVELIEAKKPAQNMKTTHIANTKYFDHLSGSIYNRKLDKNIAQKYNKM